ncbi:two-component system sensor histidine kinase VicK [Pedobacter sp. CG_S7]|uniref:ATP-binding protein n=1 Tax=Pedobacter sp. CG_S7 TaxID=3143930 RepID=UPI0033920587
MDHQNEVLFQTFLEKTLNGLVFKVRDASFLVFAVGDDFLNLLGLQRANILNKDIIELPLGLFHPSTRRVLAGILQHKQNATINPFFIQTENHAKNLYASVKITPILHSDGQVLYLLYTLLAIDNNISEAKEMISRNYLMQLLDQAPVGISILRGKELIVESANNMMLELLGKSDAILNLPLAIALPELHGQGFLKLLDDVYTWGEPLVGNEAKVFLIRNSKYETAYFNFVYQPIKDNLGVTTGIMMVAAEVTSLVLVKQQLEDSVSNFKSVVMNAHYGLLVLKGKDWIVEVANQPMLNLWEKKKEEVLGLPLMEILPELVGQPFLEHLRQVTESATSHVIKEEVFYYNTGGGIKKKYVSLFYDPMMDKEGNVCGVIAGAEDITERVESRLKSERAEEMLIIAIESANLGTWHYHPISKRLIVSPRLKALFGYTENEEMTYDSVMAKVTEEYRFMLLKAIKSSVNYGEQFNLDFSIAGNTENKLRWMRATGKIYRDNEGIPIRFSGVLMEITEHKQNEIRKNDFIAMVSHELKTPLTSLKAYVQLLALKAKQSGDVYTIKSLKKVDGQVNKMNNMIRSFLDLSRLEAGKLYLDKERFSVEKLIAEIVEETALTDRTHVISTIACIPVEVYADREKIGQVINNLLSNAIKYSNQGTNIQIGIDLKGNSIQVWVKDEGLGISKKDAEMLFSRFYRVENTPLKTVSGFGIGLYLSAEIIQRHNGNIWVESEVGKGSVFYFSLPAEGTESKEAQ